MPAVFTEYNPHFDPSKPNEDTEGCYGFLNGTLYLGSTHHALILAGLVNGDYGAPMDWETLANAKQVWGWYQLEDVNNDYYSGAEGPPRYVGNITFATDDAKQTFGLKAKLVAAFKEAFPGSTWQLQKNLYQYNGTGTSQTDYGGNAREQYLEPQEDYDY